MHTTIQHCLSTVCTQQYNTVCLQYAHNNTTLSVYSMHTTIQHCLSTVCTQQLRQAHARSQCAMHISCTTPAGQTYLLHQVQGQDDHRTLPEVDHPLLLPHSCNKQHPVWYLSCPLLTTINLIQNAAWSCHKLLRHGPLRNAKGWLCLSLTLCLAL
jgi:hypothetical protein